MNGNDAFRAVAELAASQHGAFNKEQAASQQVTSRQLRAAVQKGTLRRPVSDVFVFASHPPNFRQRCSIASLAGAVISHRAAATLHKFDGFDEKRTSPIEVCFDRDRIRKLPRVIIHSWSRTHPNDITTVDGIRCTSKARTLFQLGAVCSRDQVEVALDSALRSGAPAPWIEETAHRINRPGPTGGNVLFDIMYDPARQGALSESVLEHVIEKLIVMPDMPVPVRQHAVHTKAGIRRLDLAFPGVRLGIEGHSRRHHFGLEPAGADNVRDLQLAAVGWEIIYVTWGLAHAPDVLLPLVRATYEQRRKQLQVA